MIHYDEQHIFSEVLFRREGSVLLKSWCFALVGVFLNLALLINEEFNPGGHKDFGFLDMREGQIWNASYGIVGILLGFRTKQALGRFWEGTGLLHQMRGEWFDSVACLFAFSRAGKTAKEKEVEEFRHVLVRLMSFCHCSALEEIRGSEVYSCYDVVDISGLALDTLSYLRDSRITYKFNRVEVLLHMVQVLVTQAADDGVLKIPPPILSRVYQTLSRGFVNELNCKKITDTLFPFPYTQVLTVLLLMHLFVTPILISSVISSKVLSSLIVFMTIFSMFSLNFIAQELELPFGDDENDLPLIHFQEEMNNSLMMLLHPESDHLAKTSNFCTREFDSLNKSMYRTRLSQAGKVSRQQSTYSSFSKTGTNTCVSSFENKTSGPSGFADLDHRAQHKKSNSRALDFEEFFTLIEERSKRREEESFEERPSTFSESAVRFTEFAETKGKGQPNSSREPAAEPAPKAQEPPAALPPKLVPTPAEAPPAEKKQIDLEPTLARSMDDLNKILDNNMVEFRDAQNRWIEMIRDQVNVLRQNSDAQYRWTETVKDQVTVLGRSSDALLRIADAMPKSGSLEGLLEIPSYSTMRPPECCSSILSCSSAPSVRRFHVPATATPGELTLERTTVPASSMDVAKVRLGANSTMVRGPRSASE